MTILEEYIGGQEIQVAVINGKFRTIELVPNVFFMITKRNIRKSKNSTFNAGETYKEKI